MSITIRPAREEDLARCEELSKIPELRCLDGAYITQEFLRCYLDDGLFVAEKDGRVEGYLLAEFCRGKVTYIHFLAVDERLRGQGIGKRLLDEAKEESVRRGNGYLFLHAPERKSARTAAFYRKQEMEEDPGYVAFGITLSKK